MKSKTLHRKRQLKTRILKNFNGNKKLNYPPVNLNTLHPVVIPANLDFYQPKHYNYAFFDPLTQKSYYFDLCADHIDAYKNSKNIVYLGQGYPLYSTDDVELAKNNSFKQTHKIKHFWANQNKYKYQTFNEKIFNVKYNCFLDNKEILNLYDKLSEKFGFMKSFKSIKGY